MMKNLGISLVLACISLPITTFAQSPEFDAREVEEFSANYAACAAYYQHLSWAMQNSNKNELSKQFKEVSDKNLKASLELAMTSREMDVAVKLTHSRMEMWIKDMGRKIEGNYSNIAILMNENGDFCETATLAIPALQDVQ